MTLIINLIIKYITELSINKGISCYNLLQTCSVFSLQQLPLVRNILSALNKLYPIDTQHLLRAIKETENAIILLGLDLSINEGTVGLLLGTERKCVAASLIVDKYFQNLKQLTYR